MPRPPVLYSEGARRLGRIALERGILDSALARQLGLGATTFSSYVNCSCTPSLRRAVMLQDALGIPVRAWLQPAVAPVAADDSRDTPHDK